MWNNSYGIRGLDHLSVPVADVDHSLSFYEEILGAEVYEDDLGRYELGGRFSHTFVQIGSVRVELLGQDPGGEQPFGTHHAFAAGPNDLDAFMEHLTDHGVPFLGPCTHPGTYCVSIYFRDPDRNQLEIAVWDGYTDIDDLPGVQEMDRTEIPYVWDPAGRRAEVVQAA